jgi:gas vesicle protein
MSEREAGGGGGSGFGAFLLGIAVGAVVGFLFAPEAGDDTRRKLSKRLRNLRDVAEEKVDEVRGLLEADGDDAAGEEDEGEEEEGSTRERLRRRLDAARRRRRRGGEAPAQVEEEDEPLA